MGTFTSNLAKMIKYQTFYKCGTRTFTPRYCDAITSSAPVFWLCCILLTEGLFTWETKTRINTSVLVQCSLLVYETDGFMSETLYTFLPHLLNSSHTMLAFACKSRANTKLGLID